MKIDEQPVNSTQTQDSQNFVRVGALFELDGRPRGNNDGCLDSDDLFVDSPSLPRGERHKL